MKILLSSLNIFVDLSGLDPKKIAVDLTMGGLKVDAVDYLGHGLENVVTGKIEKIEKHPNAEKLTICTLDVASEKLTIVCGAKNMVEGDTVPVARIGAKLPCGLEIKEAALRGVTSLGMLCSEKELGFAKESSGLLILPKDTPAGTSFAKFMDMDDWIFDVDVTAQRGDAMSVLGVARDLSAIYERPLKMPVYKLSESDSKKTAESVNIKIAAPDLCSRYIGRVVDNVRISPSPAWLSRVIEKIGLRPVNNVVDITNYVTYLFGHPSHAFDMDKLASNDITVRRATAGEKIKAIDNKEYELSPGMLAICDSRGPQAIAGVMGGLLTEIGESTKKLLIEMAVFDPISVRKTSKKLNLASESSTRFARGINITDSEYVVNAIASLISELSSDAVIYAGTCDVGEKTAPKKQVKIKIAALNAFIGQTFSENEVVSVLKRLNFEVSSSAGELIVSVPPYRHDINEPCDLYEEFLRIYGYNNVADVEMLTPYAKPIESSFEAGEKMSNFFVDSGFLQCMSYSFIGKSDLEKICFKDVAENLWVKIMNPLGSEFSIMRPTMLFGLLNSMAYNRNQKSDNIRMFEIGSVYRLDDKFSDPAPLAKNHVPNIETPEGARAIIEDPCAAGIMFGKAAENQWNSSSSDFDFYRLKGVLENLFSLFRLPVEFAPGECPGTMHPKKSAAIKTKAGEKIGYLGVVNPAIAKAFDIDYNREVIFFEFRTKHMVAAIKRPFKMKEISKFPASAYDLAVMISKDTSYAEIEKVCFKHGGKNLKSVVPFDEYTGEKVAPDKKSVAFTLTFQSNDATLNDAETKKAFEDVIKAIGEKLGGQLRS